MDKLIDFTCKQYQDKIRNVIANNLEDQRAIGDVFQGLQQMLTIAQLTGNANAAAKISQFADGQINLINQVSPQFGAYLKEFLYGKTLSASGDEETADAA